MIKKKRSVSLLLCLALLFGMIPFQVSADSDDIYNIIYNSNNEASEQFIDNNDGAGYGGPTSYTIKHIDELGPEFSYANHSFISWNEETDGSGGMYEPGYSGTSMDSDKELFALWALNAPANVAATNQLTDKIVVSWTEVPTISSYKIERKDENGPYELLSPDVSGNVFEDSTALFNVNYDYRVTGNSDAYATLSAETASPGKIITLTNSSIKQPSIANAANGQSTDVSGTSLSVTLNAVDSGIQLYYTLDSSTPTILSTPVPANLRITLSPSNTSPAPITLKVVAYNGAEYSEAYVHTFNFKLAAPTSSNAGAYGADYFPSHAIIAGSNGTAIYYEMTTDGSEPADPTETSLAYPTGGIELDKSKVMTRIKAVSVATGTTHPSISHSDVAEFTYEVKANLRSLYELKTGTWTEKETKELIQAVISQLTLDEKINLIGGTKGSTVDGTAIKNNGAAGGTYTTPRLLSMGIVPLTLSDGPAGVRMGYKATTWTSPTAIASTWDTDAMYQIAVQTGKEAAFYGVDLMLSPGQNIIRNPQSGRNFEYFSEDALVSGLFAQYYTKGVQDQNVGVTLKHYAGNEQESYRSGGNTIVTERALREVYLKGFEIAVEANPWSVMCSYNRLNNIYACENEYLLIDMLRNEFNFNGFVMSDWGATQSIIDSVRAQMDLTESSLSAAKKAELKAAILAEQLAESYLNKNVENILNVMIKSNTFKGKYGSVGVQYNLVEKEQEFYDSELFKESNEIAKATATEAMVLLKNKDNVLPLSSNSKIGLVTSSNLKGRGGFGDNAVTASDFVTRGGGSAGVYFDPTHESIVSLEEALNKSFKLTNYRSVKDIKEAAGYTKTLSYTKTANRVTGITLNYAGTFDQNTLNASAASLATAAEYGIFVVSRQTGEGADNELNGNDGYYLTQEEEAALKAYADAFHSKGKKLIVLLNIGAALDTELINKYADAILITWLPGQEGGEAISEVLSGKVNPSGKLTQTFTKQFEDSPSIEASKLVTTRNVFDAGGMNDRYADLTNGGWGTNPVFYDEDVLVGYKWFDSKYTDKAAYDEKVAYAFGSGLSYTQFEFSGIKLSKSVFNQNNDNDTIIATAKVKNVGDVKGKEVVQLYIGMEDYASEGRPMKDLRGFQKIELNPGEEKTVSFTIKLSDLQYYDDGFEGTLEGSKNTSNVIYGEGKGWTVTPNSKFNVIVGNTSNNFVLTDKSEKQGVSASFVYGVPTSGGGNTTPVDPDETEEAEGEDGTNTDVDEPSQPQGKTNQEILKEKFKDAAFIPSWAVDAVAELSAKGVILGKPDGNFDSNGNVTRAEFLTMIIRGMNFSVKQSVSSFDDVPASAWFKSYVEIGVANNIIKGLGNNKFGPNLNISRQDLSVIIYNALISEGIELESNDNEKFNDDAEISPYALQAIYALKQLDIVMGVGNNRYNPKANATRAEAAVIIKRALDFIADIKSNE